MEGEGWLHSLSLSLSLSFSGLSLCGSAHNGKARGGGGNCLRLKALQLWRSPRGGQELLGLASPAWRFGFYQRWLRRPPSENCFASTFVAARRPLDPPSPRGRGPTTPISGLAPEGALLDGRWGGTCLLGGGGGDRLSSRASRLLGTPPARGSVYGSAVGHRLQEVPPPTHAYVPDSRRGRGREGRKGSLRKTFRNFQHVENIAKCHLQVEKSLFGFLALHLARFLLWGETLRQATWNPPRGSFEAPKAYRL